MSNGYSIRFGKLAGRSMWSAIWVLALPVLVQQVMAATFAKLDRKAMGLSAGITAGLALFVATLFLVLKGGASVGTHLSLLSQYFPGYDVTLSGSFLGLAYGLLCGFIGGWLFAFLRNMFVFLYFACARRSAEREIIQNLFHYL